MTHGSRIRRTPLSVAAALLLSACEGWPVNLACTDELRSAIQLSIRDAGTGATIAPGATVVVRSASVRDSVVLTSAATGPFPDYVLFEDRAREGTYEVVVRQAGYQEWRRSGVRLEEDRCGHVVAPAQLTASLQPDGR